MRYLIALGLTMIVSSCILIGDGMFLVKGELTGLAVNETCLLSLNLNSEEKTPHWRTRGVSGNFSADFTVSPYSAIYQIKVSCNGKIVASRDVRYPEDMGVGGEVQLGAINVQW